MQSLCLFEMLGLPASLHLYVMGGWPKPMSSETMRLVSMHTGFQLDRSDISATYFTSALGVTLPIGKADKLTSVLCLRSIPSHLLFILGTTAVGKK